ncbi:hypothetical protein GJAV_G00101850, partial [Gymnothorax javanicus]
MTVFRWCSSPPCWCASPSPTSVFGTRAATSANSTPTTRTTRWPLCRSACPPDVPQVEARAQPVEGSEVELTCASSRSKPPATLRWFRDRQEIAGAVSLQENGKTVSVRNTIRIAVNRRDDGAILSCEASHPALGAQRRVRH